MKSYLLTIAALSLVATGFNIPVNAQDDFNHSQSQSSASLSTNLAQNINTVPNTAEGYLHRGISYIKLGEATKALADFDRAIELNPNNVDIYINRGIAYIQLRDLEQALTEFSKAIEVNPKYDRAYYNRGLTYFHLRKPEQALTDFSQAIKINPQSAEAYTNRGAAYAELGESKKALNDFTQAILINPNDAKAYLNRGVINYYHFDKISQSREDLNKAAELFLEQGDSRSYQRVRNLLQQF